MAEYTRRERLKHSREKAAAEFRKRQAQLDARIKAAVEKHREKHEREAARLEEIDEVLKRARKESGERTS